MSLHLGYRKYDDDEAYYVVNWADKSPYLNSIELLPDSLKELRSQNIELLLGLARKSGEQVVKFTTGHRQPETRIKGYATFLSSVRGCSLPDLEESLGFKPGVLVSAGAYCYRVDVSALNANNVVPRGTTAWPGGISPRELEEYSDKVGRNLETHRDYPASENPVIQFCILEKVGTIGVPRYLNYDDVV